MFYTQTNVIMPFIHFFSFRYERRKFLSIYLRHHFGHLQIVNNNKYFVLTLFCVKYLLIHKKLHMFDNFCSVET